MSWGSHRWPHNGFRRWETANKCWFIKAGPVCDLTVCQKSIYLAEQGGRSRAGLKNWVSGRLTFSALSTPNESAPSSNVLRDTSRATGWKEQWGVELSTRSFLVFPLTHQLHTNKEEASQWPLMVTAANGACKLFVVCILNWAMSCFLNTLKHRSQAENHTKIFISLQWVKLSINGDKSIDMGFYHCKGTTQNGLKGEALKS